MRVSSVSSLAISMIIVGCTRPAPVPHRLSVEDIIHKVHCELRDAVWEANQVPRNTRVHSRNTTPQALWWKGWKAGIQLQIQTARDAGISGTADFTAPIHRGKFSLGLIAGFNKKATNSNTFNFDVYMNELGPTPPVKPQSTYRFNADRCFNLEAIEGGRRRLLAGNLGLADWMQRSAAAYKSTGISSSGHTYFVEFVITRNGSANPGFNITSPTGETYAITIKAGGKHVKTHKLTVTLAKSPSGEDSDELKELKEIVKNLKMQISVLIDIRDKKSENKFTESYSDFNEKLQKLKEKLNEASEKLNRIKISPSKDADTRIKELQLLDAISRSNSNN